MNFTHCNYLGDIELSKKETPGCRLYQVPNGDWVPSITSVTSFYNRQIFIDGESELEKRKLIELRRKQLPVELISMRLHRHT